MGTRTRKKVEQTCLFDVPQSYYCSLQDWSLELKNVSYIHTARKQIHISCHLQREDELSLHTSGFLTDTMNTSACTQHHGHDDAHGPDVPTARTSVHMFGIKLYRLPQLTCNSFALNWFSSCHVEALRVVKKHYKSHMLHMSMCEDTLWCKGRAWGAAARTCPSYSPHAVCIVESI